MTLKQVEYSGRFKEVPCTVYGLPIDIYGRDIPREFRDVCLLVDTKDAGAEYAARGNPDMLSYHTHPLRSYQMAEFNRESKLAPPSAGDLMYITTSRHKLFELISTMEGVYIVSTHIQFHMLLEQVLFRYWYEPTPKRCLETVYHKINDFGSIIKLIQESGEKSPAAVLRAYKKNLVLSVDDTCHIMNTPTPMFDIDFISWTTLANTDYVIMALTRAHLT